MKMITRNSEKYRRCFDLPLTSEWQNQQVLVGFVGFVFEDPGLPKRKLYVVWDNEGDWGEVRIVKTGNLRVL